MKNADHPSSLSAGLRCRCPNCGQGKLFKGYLTLAEGCDQCGLDYSFADPADGPAFFVMTGVGIVVTTLWAIWAAINLLFGKTRHGSPHGER